MNRFDLMLLSSVAMLGFANAAQAADLLIEPPDAPAYVKASGNWDGPYVGVFLGYGQGTYDSGDEFDVSGWLAGANVGINFTLTDGVVAGIVGDLAWSNIGFDSFITDFNVDWTGSVRGKLGFDAGSFLPYLTAGLAVASGTLNGGVGDTQTHVGWTVGAGVDVAVTDDVSIDLAYRYSDYGTQTYNIGGGDFDVQLVTHQITAGANWHF